MGGRLVVVSGEGSVRSKDRRNCGLVLGLSGTIGLACHAVMIPTRTCSGFWVTCRYCSGCESPVPKVALAPSGRWAVVDKILPG